MQVIPVIDVRGGLAVRAVAGDRARYQPLQSALAAAPDPVAVAKGYRALYPFETLYVADLDGIEGGRPAASLHLDVAAAWGGAQVWIDDGGLDPAGAPARVQRVVGSESLLAAGLCSMAGEAAALRHASILSLDFRGDAFIGPPLLLEEPALWPATLIVMTLAAVGRDAGPDIARVSEIVRRAGPSRRVHAAGGVRGIGDVRALKDEGAAGVLVASALHAGQIKAGDLHEIAGW